MNKIAIRDLLKGYKIDRSGIQNMANMTVIPLVSDREYTPIASFTDIRLAQDRNYNELEFKNLSEDIGILLQGYLILSNQRAQDRTVPYPHLIKGKEYRRVAANCVEPQQGGLFNAAEIDPKDFKILPPSLRAVALQQSTFGSGRTGALWDALSSWTKDLDLNLRSDGLISFYKKFKQQLDQFVASFEPVDNQLGSIVLMNDSIAAFDIVPKYENWLQIFRPLIRDSYGAEAMRLIQNKQIKSLIELLKSDKINNFKDLEKEFDANTERFFNKIKNIIDESIELEVQYSKLQEMNELHLVKFQSDSLIGCGVFHGDHVVYLSLVSKEIMKRKDKVEDFGKTGIYSEDRFRI